MSENGEESEQCLKFEAVGNDGKFEIEHEGFQWFSFYADKLIPDTVVAMGIKCTETGNSVTLGQLVALLFKGTRSKQEFYFLGAFWEEIGDTSVM